MSYTYILFILTLLISLKIYQERYVKVNNGVGLIFLIIYYSLLSLCIIFISFRFIGTLSGDVYGGIDSLYYKEVFDNANIEYFNSLVMQSYEPGFGTIVWFFSSIGFSYEYYQILVYAFFLYSFFEMFKKADVNVYTPFVIFLGMLLILGSVNLLRITFAIVLFYYCIFLYISKRYTYVVILSFFTITIHISSLVPVLALLFIYFTKEIKGWRYLIVYLTILSVLYFFSFNFLSGLLASTKYNVYLENESEFSLNTYIFSAFILIISSLKFFRCDNLYFNEMKKFIATLFLTLPIYLAFPIGYRFLLFYLPAIYFVLPSLLNQFSPVSSRRILYLPIYFSLFLFVVLKIYYTYKNDLVNWGQYSLNLS